MSLAVLLVFLSSFLPVLIGTGASDAPYTEWRDGYFVHLSSAVVGPWLSYLLLLGAAVANVGMFEAEMSSDALLLAGMAEKGILPAVLAKRNDVGVPTYGVCLSTIGVLLLSTFSFSAIVDMLNLLYCLGQVIEFCAFLHLRRVQPHLHRPYQVPLGLNAMTVLLSFPLAFIGIILCISEPSTLFMSLCLAASGGLAFDLLRVARERRWCRFAGQPPLPPPACPAPQP